MDCRTLLLLIVGPKRPPGHLYHLPVGQKRINPLGIKRYINLLPIIPVCDWYIQRLKAWPNNERSLIDTGEATSPRKELPGVPFHDAGSYRARSVSNFNSRLSSLFAYHQVSPF